MGIEYVPLETLLDKSGGSVYKLVIMASQRALELSEGAVPLIEMPRDIEKPTLKALLEIQSGKIKYVPKKSKGS